jgi:signal transduction histidine kinase
MEYRLRRHDGEYRWIFDQGVPMFSEEGVFAGCIGSCIDVTERKLAQEALSTVGRRLLAAQEEERARIARELHDDIGQQVTLFAIEMERIRQGGLQPRSAEGSVDGAIERLHQLARSVHDLSHRLYPPKLQLVGLEAALSGLTRELSRADLCIAFAYDGVEPAPALPPEILLNLYRVVQEALQNATKHSGALHVSVQMRAFVSGVALTITDDGVGFDVGDAYRKGLGLVSMGERLESIGGSLTIVSRPGAGTRLEIWAPRAAPIPGRGEVASQQVMT